MPRWTLLLAYPECILFEIMPAARRLEPELPVRVATPDGTSFRDRSGLTIQADFAFGNVDTRSCACVLIPGGNPDGIAENPHVVRILNDVRNQGGVVAGICAGVAVLGLAGVLKGRRIAHNYTRRDVPAEVRLHTEPLWQDTTFATEGVSTDAGVVTARPERYDEFAEAVANACGLRPNLHEDTS